MIKLNLKDFSKSPFGRYKSDSKYSAEVFRDTILIPALLSNEHVELDLNGLDVELGSSFLEETFGGLVRSNKFSSTELTTRLTLVSDDSYDVKRIEKYITNASKSHQGFAAKMNR
ncbi:MULTISPECIES: STAS-like domain-containing protein [unclassified Pseudoalteromonas]|uniref:STAS-like domain-containing protein n=1 Tax=unclassified Pseudoalteromonas TaxID=194690 RepID=UPI00110A68A4|nr:MULTISPECIES: STAS-like domain-containing protein [unclassified Pseudoalteromonas]TMP49494.1 hypothetical protein CWB80_00170 [Pseudoalteromonas sp. S1650]TMP64549.1 hypothetical protein CWB79_20240 [Pseudoalteromonas sp. S1649]